MTTMLHDHLDLGLLGREEERQGSEPRLKRRIEQVESSESESFLRLMEVDVGDPGSSTTTCACLLSAHRL